MLKSFTLKNFKSFKEATLKLNPTVTFLIGANGSGKSNALEAFRFISLLGGKGKNLDEIEQGINSNQLAIRGSANNLFRHKCEGFTLGCELCEEATLFDYQIRIVKSEHSGSHFLLNKEEWLKVGKESLFSFQMEDKSISSDNRPGNKEPTIDKKGCMVYDSYLISSTAFLTNIWTVLEHFRPQNQELPIDEERNLHIASLRVTGSEALLKAFDQIVFVSAELSRVRDYVPLKNNELLLAEDASNLSSVIKNLCDEGAKNAILDFIKSVPEQDILDIEYSVAWDTNRILLKLKESFNKANNSIPAFLLSDGTLRALAIAAALYGAPKGSLVVIEEVDNGIHPSRIKHLVDKMYEIATERKIQILVTTHDPAMMDAIPPQEKGNILCCYRNKEDGSSSILRLQDSPQYMDFLTNGRLGSFVATELFDKLVRQTEEERAKEHKAWFEQYQKEQDDYYEKLRQALKED